MKTIILSLGLMVGSTSSIKLDGIDKKELMQNNPSHWRKAWPEGDTDNGEGDADVIWMEKKKKEPKAKITYPWAYDEDVIETGKSIETAEEITKGKLTKDAVKDGGLGMIFTYDNTKVQNDRGYVHGPLEWARLQEAQANEKLAKGWIPSTEKPEDKGFQYD